MIRHTDITQQQLLKAIKESQLLFGGNKKLKIYGTLKCKSGKRMKKENRIFFISKTEAIDMGYRPCGHCLREDYKIFIKQKN
jgi:methylphosphotriester-DNA--protein-cysteine methyltransferase